MVKTIFKTLLQVTILALLFSHVLRAHSKKAVANLSFLYKHDATCTLFPGGKSVLALLLLLLYLFSAGRGAVQGSRLVRTVSPAHSEILIYVIKYVLCSQECSKEFPCQGLHRHTNFNNFGIALLTLYKVCTGDNWGGILKVKHEVHSTSCLLF